MPATATIDLITYTNNSADSTSSAKSCADNSSDFENVLNEANKAYSATENASNDATTNANNEKTQKFDNKTTEINNKTAENTNEKVEKTTEKDENKNLTEKPAENKDTQKDEPKSTSTGKVKEVKEKTENTNNETKNCQAKNSKEPDLVKTEPVLEPEPESKPKSEPKAEDKSDTSREANQNNAQQTQEPEKALNTADTNTIPVENIIEILPASLNTEVVDLTNKQNTDKVKATQNEQTPVEQAQSVQKDFNVDLTNLTKNLAETTTNKSDNIKVQTQTQQAISNLEINQQNVSPETPKTETSQSQTPQTQTPDEITTLKETNNSAPVIEVKADVIVSNANVNSHLADVNSKNNIQDNSNKTNLTQEILNKTNAQITNVEASNLSDANTNSNSSDSNSNQTNLLNRQNAHEQAVKIELENNSITQNNTQNIDLTNTTDASIQTAFDKSITQATTQSITQTATQATTAEAHVPKEISQSDILSQINNQLNTKKLQEEVTTRVNIVLKPENLGKINLELINTKEGLTAQITADNTQVKELLSKSLDNLKDSLSNQGVNVHSVTVKVDETQKQSNDMFSFNDKQPKEGNQEFSNNAQKQNRNQSEFSFNEKNSDSVSSEEAETDANIEMNPKIENTVSIGSSSGRVDYKV